MQKTPYQKNYEIESGASSYKVQIAGASRQFDCLEISLTRFTIEKSTKFCTRKSVLSIYINFF